MPQPELLMRHARPNCKISIILLDWGVRESFHSLHYLNQQTVARDEYELIWLEFYRRKPLKLQEMVFRHGKQSPLLDQWLTAGYSDHTIFNKHRLYNLGILLAQGQFCVICDSDAIFTPNFIAKLLANFERTPRAVLHVDEIRNTDKRFYPFAYPSIDEVLGEGCINWHEHVSRGLNGSEDMIHDANYGACMAAPRDLMLKIGGADEHIDYLGYICGPYDMTIRLVNDGVKEHWLRDEYLYHTWHPNEAGINVDYQGPHDGLYVSLRALQARASGRVEPYLENPWIARARAGEHLEVDQLLGLLAERDEPTWRVGNQPCPDEVVRWLVHDYHGFNLFLHQRHWYGIKTGEGYYDPQKAHRYSLLLEGKTLVYMKQLVDYYNRLPTTWWRRLGAQPLHQLPVRIARKMHQGVRRLF